MESVFKVILLVLGAPIAFALYRPLRRSAWGRRIFVVFHSVGLVLVTLFLSNRPGWRWSDQGDLTQRLNKMVDHKEAYDYIDNHFILIDNAVNKQLIADEQEDPEIGASLIITDRHRLTQLLHTLNESGAADLVIMDIDLSGDQPDSVLGSELMALQQKRKLLLTGKMSGYVSDASVYTNVTEASSDNNFVSHRILQDNVYSLAYRVYEWQHDLQAEAGLGGLLISETDTLTKESWRALNTFFPDFYLTDEKRIIHRQEMKPDLLLPGGDTGVIATANNHFYLGYCTSDSGRPEFLRNLKGRHLAGQQNIVMIGTFSGDRYDLHNTMYGALHGPVILLNLYYALEKKQHRITWYFILLLFAGYTLISWVLVYRGLDLPLIKWRISTPPPLTRLSQWVKRVSRPVWLFLHFIFVEEGIFLFLLLFVVLLWRITHQWINGLSLLIYFGIMKSAFDFIKHYKHSSDEHS